MKFDMTNEAEVHAIKSELEEALRRAASKEEGRA